MREPPGKSIMLVIAKRFFHDGRDIVVVKEAPIPFLAQLVFQFDGLPCGEIAQVLDCKVGTVWSRIHNAMESLRAAMEAGEKSS